MQVNLPGGPIPGVPQPVGDFIHGNTCLGQKAGVGVPERMGVNRRQIRTEFQNSPDSVLPIGMAGGLPGLQAGRENKSFFRFFGPVPVLAKIHSVLELVKADRHI